MTTVEEEKEIKFHPVKLYTNFFKIVCDPKLIISQFKIQITPEITETGEMRNWLFKKLLRQVSTTLREMIPFYVRLGDSLYSPKNLQHLEIPPLETKVDEQVYKINVTWHSLINQQDDFLKFFNVLKQVFEQMQGQLSLQRIGRGLYDPQLEKDFELLGISIWPGHTATLHLLDKGILL